MGYPSPLGRLLGLQTQGNCTGGSRRLARHARICMRQVKSRVANLTLLNLASRAVAAA